MLVGDALRFCLYAGLNAAARRLGLDGRAAAYDAALRELGRLAGDDALRATTAALEAIGPADGGAAPAPAATVGDERFGDLLRVTVHGPGAGAAAAEALAAGKVVALFRRRAVSAGAGVRDALVLHDPRSAETAARVHAEVGAESSRTARCALALEEELGRFHGPPPALPLAVQEATLLPGQRLELAGLEPIRLRLQVLSGELDGELFELLSDFAGRTGVGLLGAAPFHLRMRDLPSTPDRAVAAFLVTSADLLLLDDRLYAKTHGADSDRNLRPFRPRLARQAEIEPQRDGTLRAVVRGWAYSRAFRLRPELRPLLDLCDGRLTLAEILGRPEVERLGSPDQVCGLLRGLWRHQVIVFDDPDPAPPAAVPAGDSLPATIVARAAGA
jgi:hypothetical protein